MSSEVEDLREVESFRKRKRPPSHRKLPVGSSVEVRSLEDGLLGSWYSGTVIACRPRTRVVRYDSCLAEDGSSPFEETVPVSRAVDGVSGRSNRSIYWGRIRPVPPSVSVDAGQFLYGLCVDVYLEDAWWEGVIFDRNTGARERDVFFPVLGDWLVADVCNVRVAQDWIEGDDCWVRRGFWSFLEVIQEFEKEFCLPVSVRQIWYDLRQKRGFQKIKEWTCSDKMLWEKMVFETILDNLMITLRCRAMELSEISRTLHVMKSFDGSCSPVCKVHQMNAPPQLESKQSFTKPFPECSNANADSDEEGSKIVE